MGDAYPKPVNSVADPMGLKIRRGGAATAWLQPSSAQSAVKSTWEQLQAMPRAGAQGQP